MHGVCIIVYTRNEAKHVEGVHSPRRCVYFYTHVKRSHCTTGLVDYYIVVFSTVSLEDDTLGASRSPLFY